MYARLFCLGRWGWRGGARACTCTWCYAGIAVRGWSLWTKREKKRAPKVRQLPAQKHIKISVLQCRTHDWFACLVHWPKLRNVETLRMSILIVNMNKYHTGPIMAPSLVLPSNQGFLEWWYPQFSSMYKWIFHEINNPALGVPHFKKPL